jgi:hypothetical protein
MAGQFQVGTDAGANQQPAPEHQEECTPLTPSQDSTLPVPPIADRLWQLALRAFNRHGNDAELYNGLADLAYELGSRDAAIARGAHADGGDH